MTESQMKRLLLDVLPYWNYQIVKPFKQQLDKNISFEMYCFIKIMQLSGKALSISELCSLTKLPKQQITKLSTKLVRQELIKRIYDPVDRRIIKLSLTDKGVDFLHRLLYDSEYFPPFLEHLTGQEYESFKQALEFLCGFFSKIPYKNFIM